VIPSGVTLGETVLRGTEMRRLLKRQGFVEGVLLVAILVLMVLAIAQRFIMNGTH
jgi:hypothetical protein